MSAESRIKPLRDNVVIRRMEYKHNSLYVHGQKLQKGTVVAVGSGRRMRRKTRFDKFPGKEEGSIWFEDGGETGKVRPMRVKVGDIVEFGFRNQTEFKVGGEEFVLIGEQSIYGRATGSQSEALLGHKSAGFDKQGRFLA